MAAHNDFIGLSGRVLRERDSRSKRFVAHQGGAAMVHRHSRRRSRLSRKILSLRFGERLGAIKPVVKLSVEMTGLKSQNSAIRRHVSRETTVAIPNVFAAGDGRGDGGLADGRNLLHDFIVFRPGAAVAEAAEDSIFPELDFSHRAYSLGH